MLLLSHPGAVDLHVASLEEGGDVGDALKDFPQACYVNKGAVAGWEPLGFGVVGAVVN